MKKRILSGAQPSGQLHIRNFWNDKKDDLISK